MLLAGLPSARADQKTIDTRVSHSDVLVRALGLDGLHKHKARRYNQHSQKKLRLCLMRSWTTPLCHCQRDGKKKQQQWYLLWMREALQPTHCDMLS